MAGTEEVWAVVVLFGLEGDEAWPVVEVLLTVEQSGKADVELSLLVSEAEVLLEAMFFGGLGGRKVWEEVEREKVQRGRGVI